MFIALRLRLQRVEQIPKRRQSFDRNNRGTQQKICALWTEHPGGKRADCPVRQLAEDVFAVAILHVFLNTHCVSEQRMPAVVDRYRFKTMCIM
jgi:hypothetical protein